MGLTDNDTRERKRHISRTREKEEDQFCQNLYYFLKEDSIAVPAKKKAEKRKSPWATQGTLRIDIYR